MNDLNDLIQAFQDSPEPSIKTSQYFSIYCKLFSHLRNSNCTFIETGVLAGGSLFMWKKWLGENARVIGIDLNPEAKKWEAHNFEIFIGDQGDPEFWREILPKIGQVDAFLDDGGHQSFQQIVTVEEFLDFQKNNCVLVIEDTYTSFMSDFASHGPYSFLEYLKNASDLIVGRSFNLYPERFPQEINHKLIDIFKFVQSIEFFNGICALHINSSSNDAPKIMRNRNFTPIKDFRYAGKKSAIVDWPYIDKETIVEVKGG